MSCIQIQTLSIQICPTCGYREVLKVVFLQCPKCGSDEIYGVGVQMLESTKRGLTVPCPLPRCQAEATIPCMPSSPWIHAARRDMFWIETGLPKPKSKRLKVDA